MAIEVLQLAWPLDNKMWWWRESAAGFITSIQVHQKKKLLSHVFTCAKYKVAAFKTLLNDFTIYFETLSWFTEYLIQ